MTSNSVTRSLKYLFSHSLAHSVSHSLSNKLPNLLTYPLSTSLPYIILPYKFEFLVIDNNQNIFLNKFVDFSGLKKKINNTLQNFSAMVKLQDVDGSPCLANFLHLFFLLFKFLYRSVI